MKSQVLKEKEQETLLENDILKSKQNEHLVEVGYTKENGGQ